MRKFYEQRPDVAAAQEGYVRVVDESGEDYLYPKEFFVEVPLARDVEQALAGRSRR